MYVVDSRSQGRLVCDMFLWSREGKRSEGFPESDRDICHDTQKG